MTRRTFTRAIAVALALLGLAPLVAAGQPTANQHLQAHHQQQR